MAAWYGRGKTGTRAMVLAGAFACLLSMPPAGRADSGPEPVDPTRSQACIDMASDFADQDTPRGPDPDDVAAAGIDGAIVGGLIIGFAEALGGYYVSSTYKDLIAFVLLVVILSIKPTGLFTKGVR